MFRMVRIAAFGAFMAVFGLVLLVCASVMGRKAVLLRQDTRHAEATVGHSWTEGVGLRKNYKLIYQFKGQSEFVTVDEATWYEARRTKTIAVFYAGADPKVSALDLWSDALYAIAGLIFGLLCLRYAAVHTRKDLRDAWRGLRESVGVPA